VRKEEKQAYLNKIIDKFQKCIDEETATPWFSKEEMYIIINLMKKELKENDNVLDKIIKEIKEKYEGLDICEFFEDYDWDENDISEYRSVGNIEDIIEIVNKYKEN